MSILTPFILSFFTICMTDISLAYKRLLHSSPDEEPKIDPDEVRPSSVGTSNKRFAHPQHRDLTRFVAYGPSNNDPGNYGTEGVVPENPRFSSHDYAQFQARRNYCCPSFPEFGGLGVTDRGDVGAPLPKPVVRGYRVYQGKKHRQDDDEEYVETARRRRTSHSRRVDNADYATMDNTHRDVDRSNELPATNRFHLPGYVTAATGRRCSGVHIEDDDDDEDRSYSPDDDLTQDSDSELFVSQNLSSDSHRPSRAGQRRQSSGMGNDAHPDPSTRFVPENYHSQGAESRFSANPEGYFHSFGQRLEPSRHSGVPMPWLVAKDPELIDQSEVSDASLLKRNIARGEGKKVCKRGYGASDPENIAIVNMKEFDKLSFDEIARRLNDQRVKEGKQPSLSAVGVNSRYNRTAPLLFSAQGKEFVPLSKRRGRAKELHEANKAGIIMWNEELDVTLVKCVKDVDAAKWATVATLFEERTGRKLNAAAAALRHNLL
jgi:hypothetical protein